jgi:hypothetical protein
LKEYSTVTHCDTVLPSFCAGVNLICLAAAIALSVNPSGNPFTTCIFDTAPDDDKIIFNLTCPVTLFFLASSVNDGSGFDVIIAFLVTSFCLNGFA